jgi:ferritin-like metal-binding protein YciE
MTHDTMTPASDQANVERNQKAIADYVEDMHAVESHIEEALDRQLGMFDDQPNVREAVQGFHDMVKAQRDALAELIGELPEKATLGKAKDVGSSLLGKAAGVIDKIRSVGGAKALRDDYTAFNLAAVSYNMLLTTATALGDPKVAALAEKHLRGYAKAVQEINRLIPEVVLNDLEKDGLQVEMGAAKTAEAMVNKAWKETSH